MWKMESGKAEQQGVIKAGPMGRKSWTEREDGGGQKK